MEARPDIPRPIRRQVLVESGHHCAVCGNPSPLEIAHIVPWSVCRKHEASNLITLCTNCHRRADSERWGPKTLHEYKRFPWVRNKGRTSIWDKSPRQETAILIDMNLEDFDKKQERILRYSLAGFLEISPEAVVILRKEKGSVIITVGLPAKLAEKLGQAFLARDPEFEASLRPLKILDVQPGKLIEKMPRTWWGGPVLYRKEIAYRYRKEAYRYRKEIAYRDAELILRFQEGIGQEAAFEELFKIYRPMIEHLFWKKGLHQEVAEDLSQDTFLYLFRSLKSFDYRRPFDLHLELLALRVLRKHMRKRSVRSRREAQLLTGLALDYLPNMQEEMDLERLSKAVDQLPPRMSRACRLRLQGYLDGEIATVMGISKSTVRNHISEAKKRLAEIFEN